MLASLMTGLFYPTTKEVKDGRDDKKYIGPEAEKPGDTPQKKKPESIKNTPSIAEATGPSAPQIPVMEAAPKAQNTSTVESKPKGKTAPAPKVLDFSATKNKALGKGETAQEKKPVKEQEPEKPNVTVRQNRTRPPLKIPRNPETKGSKVRKLPDKSSPPLPVMLPALPSRSRSSISICLSCVRSKTILSVSVMIRK